MKTQFTKEQEQAIELRGKNILVSAAAGSGKTAVLVERIVRFISEGENPADIDRLLVVTFTSAAASEMRERIIAAVLEKLSRNPENEHLQRQSALIHNAQITTIHSFCLFVIRNHFQEIGLDPAFRVADEGETGLLMQDVLAEVLEEAFAEAEQEPEKGAAFRRLVECYSTGKKETVLEESILSLYRFAMSCPWPEEWLLEHGKDYEIGTAKELEEAPFMRYVLAYLKDILPDLEEQLLFCKQICEEPDGPYMYGETIENSLEGLKRAAEAENFHDCKEAMEKVSFERLSSKRDDTVSPEKREYVKQSRNRVKKQTEQLKEQFFRYSVEAVLEQCGQVSPVVRELTELTGRFMEKLTEKKREKNLIDFTDMEHLALSILCKRTATEDGWITTPTAASLELRNYFQEIMIDEYQDSNLVQESILSCVSGEDRGCFNRFMVGDVKQSIYKFRLARPELFMEKFHTYDGMADSCRRIDLYRNFRSRREVITGVNFLFSQLFAKNLGGIDYDEHSRLYYGADYYEQAEREENSVYEPADTNSNAQTQQSCVKSSVETGNNTTEFLLIENSGESEKTAMEQEAEAVAIRIKQLLRDNRVFDKESGMLRPVQPKDIVILLRSSSGIEDIFQEALKEQDIPCFISSRTGYFQTSEVQVLLQLLRTLDNPLQDIPLFGVLKSCFGGFQDEELAKLAAAFPGKRKLYKKLESYAEIKTDEKLREKCRSFLDWFGELRRFTVWLSIRELLEKIMEESHYLEYVAALPGGEQRRANAEMLLQKADAFEKTSFKGLYHFIRYIDQLEKYSIDYGEANTLQETANVVRIMTIHKSKGLEFPVCIVAGMGRKMNRRDASAPVLTDIDMGVAVDFTDPVLRFRQKTLRKAVLAQKILLDSQAEELRILYVALTRAKEKLIITGVTEDIKKKLNDNLTILQRKETVLPYSVRSGASSFLDLLVASVMRTADMRKILERYQIDTGIFPEERDGSILCEVWTADDIRMGEAIERKNKMQDAEAFRAKLETGVIQKELEEYLQKKFGFRYPHENLQKLYAKTTVSELKIAAIRNMARQNITEFPGEATESGKLLFEEEMPVPYLPAFLKKEEGEDKISGAARGSAVHRVMELLDFAEWTGKELEKEIARWRREGLLSEEAAKAVNRKKVLHFMESSLAERMREAAKRGRLSKEQPFMLGIGANRLSKEFPETETILVQGIIDVFFEENGEIVLVDYKTDVIKSAQELTERYRVQLDYYAEALERITGKKVKERILYSFYLEEIISLDGKIKSHLQGS